MILIDLFSTCLPLASHSRCSGPYDFKSSPLVSHLLPSLGALGFMILLLSPTYPPFVFLHLPHLVSHYSLGGLAHLSLTVVKVLSVACFSYLFITRFQLVYHLSSNKLYFPVVSGY